MKEYKDRNIEVENEAFDRYMQNVSLLEEVLSLNVIPEGSAEDGSPIVKPKAGVEDDADMMISGLKLKLRSNPVRSENFRKRIRQMVDQGLNKLEKGEVSEAGSGPSNQNEIDDGSKTIKCRSAERASVISDLIEKLNKARNIEDLKSCLDIKSQLHKHSSQSTQTETEDVSVSNKETSENELLPSKESKGFLPKLFTTTEIDQTMLENINAHFSSLEQIENL